MNEFEKLIENIIKLTEKKFEQYEPKATEFAKKLNQRIERELAKKKSSSLL